MPNSPERQQMANAVRVLAMDAVEKAASGHPGMPMGMADAATALFCDHLKFDASAPDWPDRDRFVLSAGHGSMLLYAILHLTGHDDMTMDQLRAFRQLGAASAGHPEHGHASGIETTTGPLGQGFANAVGMAMAERHLAARFGDGLVDHHTYVIAGDGCLMEGISHEAASMAGHLGLGKLVTLFDDNSISIDGSTDLAVGDDTTRRFESYRWHVEEVDGHDMKAVSAAIDAARKERERPSLVRCRTVIGKGAPNKAGTAGAHGAPLGGDEIAGAREALGWSHPPFEIPGDIVDAWRKAGRRGRDAREDWQKRHKQADGKANAKVDAKAFDAAMAGDVDKPVAKAVLEWKRELEKAPQKIATRVASQKAIEAILPVCPGLLGGSADLTGSNNTRTAQHKVFDAKNPDGTYIHYGVREHGMAAAMNGMALHGGIIPYGGTFLVFTDYCRASIRLSALMGQRVVYVMTHDSIGLGEDGPTHQPVEHLAALRAIPNLLVFRPGDAVETAEAWQCALQSADAPSVLALSRQSMEQFRCDNMTDNMTAKGAYIAAEADGKRRVTLLASGSEVGIAFAARELLAKDDIAAAVVSVPCMELFWRQSEAWRAKVLGDCPRIAIEAAVRQSWDRLIGDDGAFVGMDGFGASAPAGALFAHFGITAEAVAKRARKLVAK